MLPSRPFGVTLLLWTVLILTAWGAVRLIAALRWWDVLNEFGARLSPLYLSVTGAGWGVAGAVLLWSIATRRTQSRFGALVAMSVWQIQYWIERIFFQSPRANLPFTLTVFALVIIVIFFITFHKSTTHYFKSEEHEQPDQHTKTT